MSKLEDCIESLVDKISDNNIKIAMRGIFWMGVKESALSSEPKHLIIDQALQQEIKLSKEVSKIKKDLNT